MKRKDTKMRVMEWDQECSRCGGTGVYVGFAEQDGFGVVCHTCDGSGKESMHFEYVPFTQRKERKKIKRVLESNPGIGVGLGNGKYAIDDFGGLSYKDWNSGKPFHRGTEMRKFVCPAWWYQSADYDKKPNWKECIGLGSFMDCPNYSKKHNCWKKFDQEEKRKKG